MNPDDVQLSRRQLLAAGAGVGGLGLAGGALAGVASGRVQHDRSFQVEGPGLDLIVNWAEWYNGARVEDQGESVDADGPILTLRNVLPGDSGRLHFGLELDGETSSVDNTRLEMQLLSPADTYAENGVNEPERAAGDVTTDRGELQDHLQVSVWYDVGIVAEGVGIAGQCDGRRDVGEPVISEGSLLEVSGALGDWVPLDARPGTPGTDCLTGDDELCIGVEWSLPDDVPGVDDNVVQGDSAEVRLGFRAADCQGGDGNASTR